MFQFRHHHRKLFSSYSVGGVPKSNLNSVRIANTSKNSKIQLVAFDFNILINTKNAIDVNHKKTTRVVKNEENASPVKISGYNNLEEGLQEGINQIASLLKVDLGFLQTTNKDANEGGLLYNDNNDDDNNKRKLEDYHPSQTDIRSKYAIKLRNHSTGGLSLSGVDLAKEQVNNTLATGGDAAGHLAARKIAVRQVTDSDKQTSKWLPSPAACVLLTHLSNRTIRIVLLPTLMNSKKKEEEEELSVDKKQLQQELLTGTMKNFAAQLTNITIDNIIPPVLLDDDNNSNDNKQSSQMAIQRSLKSGILNKFETIHPNRVLIVSDRDEYMREARDMGMMICRLQQKNARRGNITPHYSVETLGEVQGVVDEINGLSFNSILNR